MTNTLQHYKVEEAYITSTVEGTETDVSSRISEFSLYENIDKPYVSGKMVFLDDSNLFERLNFEGAETITLTITSYDIDGESLNFTRTFYMANLLSITNVNERARMYTVDLVDTHAYEDAVKRFSKSYTGNLEFIIPKILVDELGLDVDLSYLAGYPPVQERMRVVVPYMSPLNAARWLTDRATTINGSPFFLTASAFQPNTMRLGNFDTMMTRESFNSAKPFQYSYSNSQAVASLGELDQSFVVSHLERHNMHDAYGFMQRGGLAAKRTLVDTFGGTVIDGKYTARSMLGRLAEQGILGPNQTVFDSAVDIDQNPGKECYALASSRTYNTVKNFHDEFNVSDSLMETRAQGLRAALERNKFHITVPGVALSLRNVSVGDTIDINFTNTSPDNNDEVVDRKKSGKYLILASRHLFVDTTDICDLTITKLDELNDV